MHRYSDYERAAALGLCVDVYRKAWTRRFDDFAQALSAEDSGCEPYRDDAAGKGLI